MPMLLTTHHSTLGVEVTRALQGPNIWSQRPLLEMLIDASDFPFSDWRMADELLESLGLVAVGPLESRGPEKKRQKLNKAVRFVGDMREKPVVTDCDGQARGEDEKQGQQYLADRQSVAVKIPGTPEQSAASGHAEKGDDRPIHLLDHFRTDAHSKSPVGFIPRFSHILYME